MSLTLRSSEGAAAAPRLADDRVVASSVRGMAGRAVIFACAVACAYVVSISAVTLHPTVQFSYRGLVSDDSASADGPSASTGTPIPHRVGSAPRIAQASSIKAPAAAKVPTKSKAAVASSAALRRKPAATSIHAKTAVTKSPSASAAAASPSASAAAASFSASAAAASPSPSPSRTTTGSHTAAPSTSASRSAVPSVSSTASGAAPASSSALPTTLASHVVVSAAAPSKVPTPSHAPIPTIAILTVPSPSRAPARRPPGTGCSFSSCNTTVTPPTYIMVTFRNRLDNLARLVASINNATAPAERACICLQIVDFETDTSAIPAWKNPDCLATMHSQHNVYFTSDDAMVDAGKVGKLLTATQQRKPCWTVEYGGKRTRKLRVPMPLHVNVTGMTGPVALTYIMSLYAGESIIMQAKPYMVQKDIKFSRAGGIQAGITALSQDPNTPAHALVFICDADMLLRPGFFPQLWRRTREGDAVWYPTVWSQCFAFSLYTSPLRSTPPTPEWHLGDPVNPGYWRRYGFGMVGAYLSDLREVRGMAEMMNQSSWGQEDVLLHSKFTQANYTIVREHAPSLVHMWHSRSRDWTSTTSGMPTGGLMADECGMDKFCVCPSKYHAALKAAAAKQHASASMARRLPIVGA